MGSQGRAPSYDYPHLQQEADRAGNPTNFIPLKEVVYIMLMVIDEMDMTDGRQ